MKRRQGFTLVELLVSMALIIFMMAILSLAFQAALGTFRNLKAQGDLAEKLRSTTQILQHDLAANHFDGARRLSDSNFWSNGPPQQGFFQIYQGSRTANGPFNFIEGSDVDSFGSFRSTDHKLSFTVKLVGNNMGDFMSASAAGSGNVWNPAIPPNPSTPVVPQLPGVPGVQGSVGLGIGAITAFGPPESRYQIVPPVAGISGYNYQWAAVAWFLAPQINPNTGIQDTTNADPTTGSPAVPLFQLYRRQCLLVPDNNLVTLATIPQGSFGVPTTLIGNFLEMSCESDPVKGATTIYFNNPNDITMPSNRLLTGWGGQPIYTPIPPGALGLLTGSDIQLNDVVSFDVRMLFGQPPNFNVFGDPFMTLWDVPYFQGPNSNPALWNNGNPLYYPNNPTGPMVFDTWSSNNTGIPGYDYSNWNQFGTATSIPLWSKPSGSIPPTGPSLATGPIIKAIQVTIRIWDFKTNQTRQVTIVQAM